MKHIAPLATLVSGLLGGWLVPGDLTPHRSAEAAGPSISSDSSRLKVAISPLGGRTALPDVIGVRGANDPQSIPAEAFSREILRLSADADRLDSTWQIYKDECKVHVTRQYDFGHEWFALWDNAAAATVDTAQCKDVPTSLVDATETIREDLLRARTVAQNTGVGVGTEVGVLKWHTLEWSEARR